MAQLQTTLPPESMVYLAQEPERSAWLLPGQDRIVVQEHNGMVAVDLADFDAFFEMVVRAKAQVESRRANTIVPMHRGR